MPDATSEDKVLELMGLVKVFADARAELIYCKAAMRETNRLRTAAACSTLESALRAVVEDAMRPKKSLSASVADAMRPFLQPGQKVIWREPFRWFDDGGVMSNHYDGMSLQSLAAEFGYEVIHDCECAGIIADHARKGEKEGG